MVQRPITPPPGGQVDGGEETEDPRPAESVMTKRYHIILRIRHPELDPAEITAALGWDPDHSWKAGDQSVTPNGRTLPSVRPDGLWSRIFRYKGETLIVENVEQILNHLMKHKDLFDHLDQMSAQSALYIALPGDTNNGARIPWHVLKKFVDLKIAFEFETFPKWSGST
jgi:hypothetical protein